MFDEAWVYEGRRNREKRVRLQLKFWSCWNLSVLVINLAQDRVVLPLITCLKVDTKLSLEQL